MMSSNIITESRNNIVTAGNNIKLTGKITGDNNTVNILGTKFSSSLSIYINGHNNKISIGEHSAIKELVIYVGNHVPAHNVNLSIGDFFSIEPMSKFFMYTSGNILTIGDDCMFSKNICIRCGESPHLIYDKISGNFLDNSYGVLIGNHVWVGENVYITKSVTICNECIVGACSVVTKRFDKLNIVIAGNPAKVVRENVQWIRNASFLEEGSVYKKNFSEYHSKFPGKP